MATIVPTGQWIAPTVHKTTWGPIASGDVCSAASLALLPDKSVGMSGTPNGGGITMQGSNNTATGPWAPLTDPQGNTITLTATTNTEAITENTQFIRPTPSGGSGSLSLTVYVVAKG